MTITEWKKYFDTLPHNYQQQLLTSLKVLAADAKFREAYNGDFIALAWLLQEPLTGVN